MDKSILYDMINSFPYEVPVDYVFLLNKNTYEKLFKKEWIEGVMFESIKMISVNPPFIKDDFCYLMKDPRWVY
tara:strand:- start:437 stop:655 length:219 start_codon:yes stop_codon:yes gene_type:complete